MSVGVVTVTYNSGLHLQEFLDCVQVQTAELTLYAIDNKSTDFSVALIQRHQALAPTTTTVILNDSNRGVARANNQGIRAALEDGHTHVLLLNNDVVFDANFVESLLASAQSHPDAVISPLILADDPADSVWFAGGSIRRGRALQAAHHNLFQPKATANRGVYATGYAPTCALLVPRAVFDQVGLMDEAFFVYCDDVDFAIRLTSAAVAILVDSSIIMVHKVGGSTGGTSSDFGIWWESCNQVLLLRKHARSSLERVLGCAFLTLRAVIRFLIGKDSAAQATLRCKALRHGFRLSQTEHQKPDPAPWR